MLRAASIVSDLEHDHVEFQYRYGTLVPGILPGTGYSYQEHHSTVFYLPVMVYRGRTMHYLNPDDI